MLCIPSFEEIGPPLPEKKILKGFTIYGHAAHLDHVTIIISVGFHFHVPEKLHTKFDLKGSSSF